MDNVIEKVAIIILNYKAWRDTLNEVKLLNKVLNNQEYQIIVVDNCSLDKSYKYLKKHNNGQYILIKSDKNGGYAYGNNIGLKYAKEQGYKYAWILNNDILFNNSGILKEILSVFQLDHSLAVVNPDIYSPDGYLFNRDSKRPGFLDFTFGILKYKKTGRHIDDLGGYGYIYRPQGCCMVLDLLKAAEVNYLDENTFLYCEEMILAEKLLIKNYHCACCTKVKVIHNHSKTVKSILSKGQICKVKLKSFYYYLKTYRSFSKVEEIIICLFYLMKVLLLK